MLNFSTFENNRYLLENKGGGEVEEGKSLLSGYALVLYVSPSVPNEHERKSCPQFLSNVEYHRGIRQMKGGVFCLIFGPTCEGGDLCYSHFVDEGTEAVTLLGFG